MHILLYILFIISNLTLAHGGTLNRDHFLDKVPWYGVIDKKDLSVTAALSATFFGGSFLVENGNTRTAIQGAALLFPLVRFLSTTKITKKALNNCPLIKHLLGCSNTQCDGICDRCVIMHILTEAGMGIALFAFTPKIDAFIQKISGQSKNQKNVLVECDICNEDKPEANCASLQCCKDKTMCGTCIKTYYEYNKDTYKAYVECPFCRKPLDCVIPEEKEETTQTKSASIIRPSLGLLLTSYFALPAYNSITQKIPVIDRLFECENKAWHGVCGRCKLRNAQKGAAVFIGSLLLYSYFFGSV